MQVEAVFAPTRRWYVVLVEPSAEAKVAERAGELGFEVYFPRSRRPAIVAPGRKAPALKEIERPALPGYVFVALPIGSSSDILTYPSQASGVYVHLVFEIFS